jgi:excinuclease ABC subunit C
VIGFSAIPSDAIGERFAGFGESAFGPPTELATLNLLDAPHRQTSRKLLRQCCPAEPGVYGMLDAAGTLIYVGKSKRLRLRLLSYFQKGNRDSKSARILASAKQICWEQVHSEFGSLLRELELIRRWRPRYNVQGQPDRRQRSYICLGRAPAPYAYVAAQPGSRTTAFFGPVPGGGRAREAARRLNDWFQLRDCPENQSMVFADQGELFPIARAAGCLRYDVGKCAGPCAGLCTRRQYFAHVRAAEAFLKGSNASLLDQLQLEMLAAAKGSQFERAAAVRDTLTALAWLREQLDRVEQARKAYSFVYAAENSRGIKLWYLIREGQVAEVVVPPSDRAGGKQAASIIRQVYEGGAERSKNPVHVMDQVWLVLSWFRRHPDELEHALTPEAALNICRNVRTKRAGEPTPCHAKLEAVV